MEEIMTVRAPEELKNELKKLAKEEGYTRNGLVLKILWDWVKKQEK